MRLLFYVEQHNTKISGDNVVRLAARQADHVPATRMFVFIVAAYDFG